jgi:hypothetical protein
MKDIVRAHRWVDLETDRGHMLGCGFHMGVYNTRHLLVRAVLPLSLAQGKLVLEVWLLVAEEEKLVLTPVLVLSGLVWTIEVFEVWIQAHHHKTSNNQKG